MTIVEIAAGLDGARDPASRARLELWLQDGVRASFAGRILDADEAVLAEWLSLMHAGQKAGHTFAQPDALIAATARVHRLAVVTRNVRDFARAGLAIVNPWL